ncbi:hypothetical protein HAX54_047055, partial [Datura stramonium]|nr:hypothetical protein [Datura stramonium]
MTLTRSHMSLLHLLLQGPPWKILTRSHDHESYPHSTTRGVDSWSVGIISEAYKDSSYDPSHETTT